MAGWLFSLHTYSSMFVCYALVFAGPQNSYTKTSFFISDSVVLSYGNINNPFPELVCHFAHFLIVVLSLPFLDTPEILLIIGYHPNQNQSYLQSPFANPCSFSFTVNRIFLELLLVGVEHQDIANNNDALQACLFQLPFVFLHSVSAPTPR